MVELVLGALVLLFAACLAIVMLVLRSAPSVDD